MLKTLKKKNFGNFRKTAKIFKKGPKINLFTVTIKKILVSFQKVLGRSGWVKTPTIYSPLITYVTTSDTATAETTFEASFAH